MPKPVLYHNPQCSKSRGACSIVDERRADVEVVRYLDTPPSRDELVAILAKLDTPPASLVRTGEALFKELGVDKATLDDPEAVADLLAAHPRLIERPLLVTEDAAVIGRPPERILDLLG
jgi:arsenate reductase (glutaredoxin)